MNYSELKQLFELFDGNKVEVNVALSSIAKGFVEFDEIINENYISHDGYCYSSDDYVVISNGDLIDRDESFWCTGMEEYFHNDDMVTVYEGRYEQHYSRQYIENNSEFICFDGEYYDDHARDRHDLVYVEDEDRYGYRDNYYYHEGDGYYSYPDDQEDYVRGYHNGSYQEHSFSGKSKYAIGFEIEKEDRDVRESICIEDFESNTNYLWRKEKDGSLCDDSGYELISPTFEFDIDKIFELIESNDVLVNHINARYSTCCGGHIHLSETDLNGEQLFDKIKGYTPLLYALYHGRVDKNYCKGKNNEDLKNENEKYQAVKIHHNRVEFRIISAVPNVTTLKWRCKLLMMILQHPTDDVIKAYYNVDTKFTKLLSQVYSPERLIELKERFVKFTKQFENLNIK
jgi:hypothetical protein